MTDDDRLDRMIEIARDTGLPLDHVVAHMARCEMLDHRRLIARATER